MSGKLSVPEVESFMQEVMREAEDESSPLSTSPSAKMIKIEEIADVPSHSDQLVALHLLCHDWLFYLCS